MASFVTRLKSGWWTEVQYKFSPSPLVPWASQSSCLADSTQTLYRMLPFARTGMLDGNCSPLVMSCHWRGTVSLSPLIDEGHEHALLLYVGIGRWCITLDERWSKLRNDIAQDDRD